MMAPPESPTHSLCSKNEARTQRLLWGLCALLVAAHVALLQRKGLWNNEFITLSVIRMPWGEMIAERLRLNHMPGYFLMLKAWTDAFGLSAFALRFPSALFSIGAIGVTWLLAREAYGPGTALRAALAAALHQNLIVFSADARMYSAVVFWTLLSMYGYLRLLHRRSLPAYVIHFVAGVGGVFFHLLFLLVYPIQILHYITLKQRGANRLPILQFAGLLVAPLAVWSPWVLTWTRVQNKVGQDALSFPSISRGVRELLKVVWGDYNFSLFSSSPLRAISLPAMFLIIGLVVRYSSRAGRRLGEANLNTPDHNARRQSKEEPAERGLLADSALAWWLLTPPVLIWLASFRSESILSSLRYYVAAGAAVSLVLARVSDWLPHPRLSRAWTAVVFFLLGWYTLGWVMDLGSGLRETTRHFILHAAPTDAVLLNQDRAAREAFPYYGVENPFHALDREDYTDLDRGVRQIRLREDAERLMASYEAFWLVMYHSDNRSLPEVLNAPECKFHQVGKQLTFGDSRLYRFVRRDADAVRSDFDAPPRDSLLPG